MALTRERRPRPRAGVGAPVGDGAVTLEAVRRELAAAIAQIVVLERRVALLEGP